MTFEVGRCPGAVRGMRFPGMLLVIAALPYEFSGFQGLVECDFPGVRWSATTVIRGSKAMFVANGVGRCAAARGARIVLARSPIRALISTGFAGALDPALRVGEVLLATTVLGGDRSFGGSLPLKCPPGLRRGALLTVDEIVQSAREKRQLAKLGAHAVDMEAASVAAVAAEHDLPFYCVRSISDHAERNLPLDFGLALRPDGTFSLRNVFLQAVCRVDRWLELLVFWRGARLAARSLAKCLAQCQFCA